MYRDSYDIKGWYDLKCVEGKIWWGETEQSEPEELSQKATTEEQNNLTNPTTPDIDVGEYIVGDLNDSNGPINIVDIFKDLPMTITSSGSHKMECPDCGLQGGRTEGFILFPESNTAYCHTSGKWFRLLEAYALKKKVIRCLDGREKGEKDKKVLEGELYTMTLEEFRNEYGAEKYDELTDQFNIKTSIELPGNDSYITTFADKLGEVYKSRNVLFFRGESKEVVEIHRYKKISKHGDRYVETGFMSTDGGRLVSLIEMFVKPYTYIFMKNGSKKKVAKSMTQNAGGIVLKSSNFQNKVPSINRIFDIPVPILYKKEITFPKKGYDKRFGSWLSHNAPQISVPNMSLEQAKSIIDIIFAEFCFANDKDKTHAIAGFLTPYLHGLLPKFSTRTPVYIYMANRERAGKDYLAGCTGMVFEGCKTEEPAICNDEKGSNNEELRKKITACMRQGKKRFHSANNKGLLNNSIFEGVTTAEVWNDRLLGKSEVLTFSNEIDYSLSGNIGIKLTPDMSNRSRIINLHLVDEDANARKFKNPNLHGWILENRELIISALFALVRNWAQKGMKPGSVPFASFPEWSSVCGGIMEAAGYENPCEVDKTAIVSLDSDTEEMKLLFEAVYLLYPDKWLNKKDIQEIVENEGLMAHLNFNERADQVKFGIKIDKFTKRILSDIFMDVDSLTQRSSRRKFKFTKNSPYLPKKESSIGNVGEKLKIDGKKTKDQVYNKFDDNVKSLVKSGNLGNLGNLRSPTQNFTNSKNTGIGNRLPILPRLPTSTEPEKVPVEKQVVEHIVPNTYNDSKKLNDFEDVRVATKQIRAEKREKIISKPKEKSDRELQFFEDPQCENIIVNCSKDEVYKWIESNPKIGLEKMYSELGLGCLKFATELVNEKRVRRVSDDGWEAVNDIIDK